MPAGSTTPPPTRFGGWRKTSSLLRNASIANAKAQHEVVHPDTGRGTAPILHPYLVVPATLLDLGVRPLQLDLPLATWQGLYDAVFAHAGLPALYTLPELHNASVNLFPVLDKQKHIVDSIPATRLKAGTAYQVRCYVWNLGQVPALMGFAEFFATTPADFDFGVNGGSGDPKMPPFAPAPLGYAGFSVPNEGVVTIRCNNYWTPTPDQLDKGASIVAQVYDPTADFVAKPLNAIHDRHVARLDISSHVDFTGFWAGDYFEPGGNAAGPGKIYVRFEQSAGQVAAQIYIWVPPGASSSSSLMGKLDGENAVFAADKDHPVIFSFTSPAGLRMTSSAGAGPSHAELGRLWTCKFT